VNEAAVVARFNRTDVPITLNEKKHRKICQENDRCEEGTVTHGLEHKLGRRCGSSEQLAK